MEVMIILQKCSKTQKLACIRVEKRAGDWYRTWATKISEKSAKNQGFDKNSIKGSFISDPEFPGCPYCGAKGFYQCGACGKLCCWKDERTVTCGWCGKIINLVERKNFNIKSGTF